MQRISWALLKTVRPSLRNRNECVVKNRRPETEWTRAADFVLLEDIGMLLERTWNYISEYQLIRPGERILVGFSGGADSLCLLLLLHELGKQHGFTLQAVHVNHMLRGEESDGDQAFAEEFCRRLDIPIHCFSYPVEEMARKMQVGIEEAGREARRCAFRKCMDSSGAEKTALAHHRDDQAETVLFRLARGSSLAGLSGIRPRQGKVIHPLLFASKEEILRELEDRGIPYRTDSSNLTDHYTRNCIRHQIMPILQEKVNDRSIEHIVQAAGDIAETDEFLKKLSRNVKEQCILVCEQGILVKEEILEEEPVLVRYVLMDALSMVAGGRKDLGRDQVSQLLDLLKGGTGRKNSLPGNLEAVRGYEGVVLRRKAEEKLSVRKEAEEEGQVSQNILGPGEYSLRGWKIRCEVLDRVPDEIPEKRYTKWLDYDKIKHHLEFRTRRTGDFLVTTEKGGRKKLKSYFIDEKIPAEERGKLLLLAAESRVFWVVGYRISEDCKITAQTRQVLKITVSEETS